MGQDRAKRILMQSIEMGRVSHAYLFIGPEGIGKRSLALAFAAALNCIGESPACGECTHCRRIMQGNHPDLTVIEPEGKSFKIEQIRKLQQLISFKPYEGRYKIFVLDGVEAFTEQAANSLLKTLEEPPSHSVLILLANENYVLPTISSRCTIVHLQPLPQEQVREVLVQKGIADAESIAAVSGGALGQAIKIAETWPELKGLVHSFLEAVSTDRAWSLDSALYTRFKEDQSFRQLFLDISQQEYKRGMVSEGYASVALAKIKEARERLRANVNPEAVLRSLAIELARLQRRAV